MCPETIPHLYYLGISVRTTYTGSNSFDLGPSWKYTTEPTEMYAREHVYN